GRGPDDNRFISLQCGGVAALQFLDAAILAPHGIRSDLTGFAAFESERVHSAMAGEDGAVHALEESYCALDAVARVPLSSAARAGTNVGILEQHRIAKLQHF